MPTFDTPEPISVTIDRIVGDVWIVATDRTDTTVEVRPRNKSKQADAKAAENAQVEYVGGRLVVRGPKLHTIIGRVPSINVTVELPSGSTVSGDSDMGDFSSEGRLGDCTFKSAMGHIRLGDVGSLHAITAMGDVTVGRVAGDASIDTGSGEVRIGRIGGSGQVKNSNGANTIGEVAGDLVVRAANGSVFVDRPQASVTVKTANGHIRVGEATSGEVELETASGEISVGIRKGTAAWLDVSTKYGTVHNVLEPAEGPAQSDSTVEVRARTSHGDIVISRTSDRKEG